MASKTIHCPKCGYLMYLRVEQVSSDGYRMGCARCRAHFRAYGFPALFRDVAAGETGRRIQEEGTSSCFYHPDKQAAVVCDGCGRFLCGLCDLEIGAEHLCPQCFEKGGDKQKADALANEHTRYDTMALALAILPLLLFYFTLITAPIVMYLVIRYWKKPGGIIPRSRIRFIAAFALAAVQIVGWILFFALAVT